MCFIPEYSYILSTFSPFYRRIEFGTCPVCSTKHFRDYIQFIDGDERIKDLYVDLYTKIFISASDGNYAIHCENQNIDELDKIVTLFKIDGFTVETPLSPIITISWR